MTSHHLNITKRPATIKELKAALAALAALKDTDKVTVYEGADITKMPAISYLKATGKTVVVI